MPLPYRMLPKYRAWQKGQPDWKKQTFSLLMARWDIEIAHYLIERKPSEHPIYIVEVDRLAKALGMQPLVTDEMWEQAIKDKGPDREMSMPLSLVAVEEKNVESVAPYMDEPIYLVEIDGGAFPIDGMHRIYRAKYVDSRAELNCQVLNKREEKLCRLH